MTKKLTITCRPAGAVSIEAQGFNGKGCAATIDKLLAAMTNVTVVDRQPKPEFFDTETATEVAQDGGNGQV